MAVPFPSTEGAEQLYAGLAEAPLVVPVQLAEHYMRKAGQGPVVFEVEQKNDDKKKLDDKKSSDEKKIEFIESNELAQVVSFAAQKFLATILHDTMQHHKMRVQSGPKTLKESGYSIKDKRRVLRTEDLTKALEEYGITHAAPLYYVDPSAPASADK